MAPVGFNPEVKHSLTVVGSLCSSDELLRGASHPAALVLHLNYWGFGGLFRPLLVCEELLQRHLGLPPLWRLYFGPLCLQLLVVYLMEVEKHAFLGRCLRLRDWTSQGSAVTVSSHSIGWFLGVCFWPPRSIGHFHLVLLILPQCLPASWLSSSCRIAGPVHRVSSMIYFQVMLGSVHLNFLPLHFPTVAQTEYFSRWLGTFSSSSVSAILAPQRQCPCGTVDIYLLEMLVSTVDKMAF